MHGKNVYRWCDERRATWLTEKIKKKKVARDFFHNGRIFYIKFFDGLGENRTLRIYRLFSVKSSSDEFWTAFEKALFSMIYDIRSNIKDFNHVSVRIMIGKACVFNHRPRLPKGKALYIHIDRGDTPKPL